MTSAALSMQTLDVNGLRVQVAVQGSGPLVLLWHGFPELWISWRAQLDALAASGYRAVAPDMRGYGGTSAPDDATAYTQLHLVGDMVDLVRALNETHPPPATGIEVPKWMCVQPLEPERDVHHQDYDCWHRSGKERVPGARGR